MEVQLVTGLSPSVEFNEIETTLFTTEALAGTVGTPLRVTASQANRYQQGSELAAYDVEPGNYRVRVVLFRRDGSELARQSVVVQVSRDYVLRVHITRDCAGVMCPGSGAEELTACLAAQCVDPRCDSAHPELCPGVTFCSDASTCPTLASCATQACIDGICVEQSAASACSATEWCHPERGCTPLTGGDEGYGSVTRGGEGYEVVHVTNLDATGEGSLRDAIGSNRTVVFDVAGTIIDFRFDSSSGGFPVSNLTIDGTTAPPPGITLDNNRHGHGLSFQDGCHDIIVRGIRMRNAGEDGFSIASFASDPPYNILFDRCSSAGNSDGAFDITSEAHDITIQNSIFGGGEAAPQSGYTGVMLISYGSRNVSVHHNLFSPRTEGGPGEACPAINNPDATEMPAWLVADFRNNVVWKWGRDNGTGSGYASAVWDHMTANFVGNYYFSEQNPESAINIDNGYGDGPEGFAYMAGNVSGNDAVDPNARSNHEVFSVPFAASVTTQDACSAARLVLQQSGVRPLDAIDQALVDDVILASCD